MNITPPEPIGSFSQSHKVEGLKFPSATHTSLPKETPAAQRNVQDSVSVSSYDKLSVSDFYKMVADRNFASKLMSMSPSADASAVFVKALESAVRNAVSSVYSLLKKLSDEFGETDESEKLYLFELLMKLETQFTYQHSCRVTDLSAALAERLGNDSEIMKEVADGAKFKELGQAAITFSLADDDEKEIVYSLMRGQLQAFRDAGEFHDIGKINIPEEIINKPDRLTDIEFEIMKQHPVIGEALLRPIKSMAHVLPTVRHHHERWDGGGYPDGIKEREIPLSARIVTVTDSFDAMTSDRPYRKAFSPAVAVEELIKNAGSQFAPDIVASFVAFLRDSGELGGRDED